MFGALFATLFGGILIKEWCDGERIEQRDRKIAQEYGDKLYIDKYGHYRYVKTKKRYTSDDAKKDYKDFCEKQEERVKKWNDIYDDIEREYILYYNDFIKPKHDITYEEWIIASQDVMNRFYQKYKNMFSKDKIKTLRDYGWNHKFRK